MDVICPQCGTTYELEAAQIQSKSVRVKCSACEYMFRVYKPTPSLIVPALQNWIVRSMDGVISHVPDQATLQRMIVERKVNRDDELSRDGRAWQLLGDVTDFQPFFGLVEQATVSNAMLSAVTGSGAFPAAAAAAAAAATVTGPNPVIQSTPEVADPLLLAGSMDPKSTLEFGLPAGFQFEKAAAQAAAREAATSKVVLEAKTEIAVEAVPDIIAVVQPSPKFAPTSEPVKLPVSTENANQHSMAGIPDDSADKATEVALEGISAAEVAQDARGSSSQEMAVRVSPPSSASFDGPIPQEVKDRLGEEFDLSPIENEGSDWFTGSAADLNEVPRAGFGNVSMDDSPKSSPSSSSSGMDMSFSDERSGSGMDVSGSDMRDFSNFSDISDNYDPSDSIDFVISPPSRKGMWVGIFLVGIVVIFGGLYTLQPELFARFRVSVGMAETTPAAMKKVKDAQAQIAFFNPKSFARAKAFLTEAEQIHGGPFTSLLASRIELELAHTEFQLFRMYLAKKQKKSWRKKADAIAAEIMKIPADDPKKDEKNKAIELRKQAALAKSGTYGKTFSDAFRSYQTHWKAASQYRSTALQKDPHHPLVELAELHLYSLSADAKTKFLPLYKKLFTKFNDPLLQTRLFLLDAWVSLHEKKYSKGLERIRKILADQSKWGYPQLLQARGFAESGNEERARKALKTLLDQQPSHALAMAFQTFLRKPKAPVVPTPRTVASAPTDPRTTPGVRTAPNPRRTRSRSRSVGSFRGLLRSADRLRRRERYKRARRLYSRAMKMKKTSRVYSGLGWCALELSGPSAAIRYFKTAGRISRRNPDALFGLGLAYRRGKKNAKAKKTLKEFMKRFPRHRDAGEVRMILRAL